MQSTVVPRLAGVTKELLCSIPKLGAVEKVPDSVMRLVTEVAVKKTGLVPL